MKKRQRMLILLVCGLLAASALTVGAKKGESGAAGEPMTLARLAERLPELENQEVTLTATCLGSCPSGCKIWVGDPGYQQGDLFALVRAKDDAFKFSRELAGRQVTLRGFAVGRTVDTCATAEKEARRDRAECDGPLGTADAAPKVREITFFATSIAQD